MLALLAAAQVRHQPHCRSQALWTSLTVLGRNSSQEIQLVLHLHHVRLADQPTLQLQGGFAASSPSKRPIFDGSSLLDLDDREQVLGP